jgi:HTH-type transcriptional regulator, sugar sensing transcriptional regulator
MKNILQNYGLNDKEAEIYLAALELGHATGFQIYKKTTIKKPTVYYHLDELHKRGFLSFTSKGNKKYYVAEDPEKIKKNLEEKLSSFEDLLPQLRSIYNVSKSKPKVRFYEGKNGLKEVYADTLKYKSEILAFASEGIVQVLGKDFTDEYISQRVKNNIPLRGIVPETPSFEKLYLRNNLSQSRSAKTIDAKKYNFPIEINIYANKVALISFRDEIGLIIESDEITKMMKMLFEFFWKAL